MSTLPIPFTFIYALIDPRTGQPRYVGKANDPVRRCRAHIKRAPMRSDHNSRWICSLLALGLRPGMLHLERCEFSQWKQRECWWIERLRAGGHDLTNCKSGGDGLEPTSRHRMRAAKIGNTINLGRKATAQTKVQRQRLRGYQKKVVHTGHPHSEAARKKISTSLIGTKRALGHKHTPETRAKMSAARKGHEVSDGTRKRISQVKRDRSRLRAAIRRAQAAGYLFPGIG